MADKEWQINCPHCQRSFVRNEDQIFASNLRATLLVLKGRPDARALLENYVIHCPGCEELLPFEPRSRYRQRKELAVEHRLEALAEWPAADDADRAAIADAIRLGTIFHRMLTSDFPLTKIRESRDKFLRVISEDAAAGKSTLKGHSVMRSLRDIMAIACGDIGERNDLPEAPVDEVEEKRAALLKSLDALHAEQREQSVKPHAKPHIENPKDSARVVPTPGGKSAIRRSPPAWPPQREEPVSREKSTVRRRWLDTLFMAGLGIGLLCWAANLFHDTLFWGVVAGLFGLACLFVAVLGPASGQCPLCGEMLHGLWTIRISTHERCPHCRAYFSHSDQKEVSAEYISAIPCFSIPIGQGERLPSLCCVCAAPARRVKEVIHRENGGVLKIPVPYCGEHDENVLTTSEDLSPSNPLLKGPGSSDHRLVLKVRSYGFYRQAVLR